MALALTLTLMVRNLDLELILKVLDPLSAVELARLACVHAKFNAARGIILSQHPPRRALSPFIPLSCVAPPTRATLDWLGAGKHNAAQRAAVLGDLAVLVRSPASTANMALACLALTTDQLDSFALIVSDMLERHQSKPKKLLRLARVAVFYGANRCLEWLVTDRWTPLQLDHFAALVREAMHPPIKLRRHRTWVAPTLPSPCLRKNPRFERKANAGAVKILSTRWNLHNLIVRKPAPTAQDVMDYDSMSLLESAVRTRCIETMLAVFATITNVTWDQRRLQFAIDGCFWSDGGGPVGAAFLRAHVAPLCKA
jgi:hypothetical protein